MRAIAKTRLLILKKEDQGYVALTPEGEFHVLPPGLGNWAVGEEVEVNPKMTGWVRILSLAACLLLTLLGWQFYLAVLPPAVAYVSLDINPSLELAVDANGHVVKATPLNVDGLKLIEGYKFKRMPLDKAIDLIVHEAMDQGYLKQGGKVLATLVPVAEEKPLPVTANQVAVRLEAALGGEGAATKVLVASASVQERKEALDLGLSVGKYILVRAAQGKDGMLHPKELAGEGLVEIEVRSGVKVEEVLQTREREGKPGAVTPSKAEKGIKPQSIPPHPPGKEKQETTGQPPKDHSKGGSATLHRNGMDGEVPAKRMGVPDPKVILPQQEPPAAVPPKDSLPSRFKRGIPAELPGEATQPPKKNGKPRPE